MHTIWTIWSGLVHFISGEWLLDSRPNGGDVIVARTVVTAAALYLLFIALKHALDPGRTWQFSPAELRKEAHASLPILGALVAGVYAALYARFAAQWKYLADLYNQLVLAETRMTGHETAEQREALDYWRASFIEDAQELHLCHKGMFVPAIRHWLNQPGVKEAYLAGTIGADDRLEKLEQSLARLIPPDNLSAR